MQTFLKPTVSSRDHLYFFGNAFRLAVSIESGRERVLFLRDDATSAEDENALVGQTGDLGFKVQRELRQGRDVFVLSGQIERHPGNAVTVDVNRADLHVRPEIVDATGKLVEQNAPALQNRLLTLAARAVQETLGRTGRALKVVTSPGAVTDEGAVVTGVTDEDDFIDPDLLDLTPISEFF